MAVQVFIQLRTGVGDLALQLCQRLREQADRRVPVLMLTGLDDDASIERAYSAGATDFFVKSNSQWTLLSERLRYMLADAGASAAMRVRAMSGCMRAG